MNPVALEELLKKPLQRARGEGSVATQEFADRTRIKTLYQDGCAKIRLPNTHSRALEAVLINTAGGLTGGDRIAWAASVAAGGHLVLTTQACERSYRSTGDVAQVTTRLTVGAQAHLDWLPQETILFAGSKLRRQMEVDLAEGATLTAIEAVLLGRDAMGEDARDAMLSDNWRIRRNGRLVHAEATLLTGAALERDSMSLLSGSQAFASIVHIAKNDDAAAMLAERLRPLITPSLGLSVQGARIVIRAMATSGLALRRMIVPLLVALTGAGSLPRLWHL
jgi:urease accessory protein